ncbi:hypothetical protein L484_015331 [Morus notabilis]|uniref:Uncharacterized protein n=1 Tax=Morus notabilis TaxID=981085 RepID=W9RMI6_9ROSA|nr:hypothetical protein L484_015331 [Morus notabilis]
MIPLSLNPIQFSSSLKPPIFRPNPSLFKSSPDRKLGPYEVSSDFSNFDFRLLRRKIGVGICRAELSHDAPFIAAIGACMLSSLVLPVAGAPDDDEDGEDAAIDSTDARCGVMRIISFIPYFNWLVRDDDDLQEMREEDEKLKSIFIDKDAPPSQSIQGKLNSNSELPCEGQSSGDKSLQSEYLNKKGKILECDVQESGFQENMGLKKNGSITEATTSTSDKEIVMSKNRTLVKVCQTYSGPLMPDAAETTASERERLLLMKISELQARFLQQQLIAVSSQEENGDRGEGGL